MATLDRDVATVTPATGTGDRLYNKETKPER